MAKRTIYDKLFSNVGTALEFNYDSLTAPPITSIIPARQINYMRDIATNVRLSSKLDYKIKELSNVMAAYGFVRYHAGTHRQVYRHVEIPTIVSKLSINTSSMNDNLREFRNQSYLKPFCTKVFETDPSGFMGLFERVDPFTSKEEFASVAPDIFEVIYKHFLSRGLIIEDMGTDYHMNWGIRRCNNTCFGPVLLDFSDVFILDGDKLYCNRILPNGFACGGAIDYDAGINQLKCTKCGCPYEASELEKQIKENEIIMKGETSNMKIECRRNGVVEKIITNQMTDTIEPPKKKEVYDPMAMFSSSSVRFNPKTKKGKLKSVYKNDNGRFIGTSNESVGTKVPDALNKSKNDNPLQKTISGFISKREEYKHDIENQYNKDNEEPYTPSKSMGYNKFGSHDIQESYLKSHEDKPSYPISERESDETVYSDDGSINSMMADMLKNLNLNNNTAESVPDSEENYDTQSSFMKQDKQQYSQETLSEY